VSYSVGMDTFGKGLELLRVRIPVIVITWIAPS
jgi:hypothetical protein